MCRITTLSQVQPPPTCSVRLHRLAGTPWIVGGDLATLYPFLAFRLPRVRYSRRWLTVDADDTRKKADGARLETDGNGRNGGGSHESSNSLDGFTDCGVPSIADGGEADERVNEDADDKEAVALDIALPEKGLDPAKPFYLVLHGLTGGSGEVCVCVCARGCWDRVWASFEAAPRWYR